MGNSIRIRVLRVPGFKPRFELDVPTDAEGTPTEVFWRRRLRDAKRDRCCEVVQKVAEVTTDEERES